jgi:hypothetical protein
MTPPVRGYLKAGNVRSRRKRAPKNRSLAFLRFHPPFGGGQTLFTSHLRRQISGNFHARANFGDDRGIPGHESHSLSLSPRGAFLSHERKLTPFARCVICSFRRRVLSWALSVEILDWLFPADPPTTRATGGESISIRQWLILAPPPRAAFEAQPFRPLSVGCPSC